MTNTKKYAKLHQALTNATYAEVYMLKQNFKEAFETGKDFSKNKELNEAVKHYVTMVVTNDVYHYMTQANEVYDLIAKNVEENEVYDLIAKNVEENEVYDLIAKNVEEKEAEQEFNNIVGYCYEFMEFEMFSGFNLALAFYDFYRLTNEEISNLFKEVEYEYANYFEALETFKESKKAEDLMIFMRSFAKARKVNILEGFVQAKNFNNRRYVINTLIAEAGLEENRLDFPRYDHTFNEFVIKDITKKEEKVLYELNLNEEIKKIGDFENFGMTLIVV